MDERHNHALVLFEKAYALQMEGSLEEAIRLYSRSIEAYPTAEAYTFRGWTYSFLGDFNRAIEECLRAIEVDPAYGNPYNDIGAYLIEQGRWNEAISWLERATRAPRYDHTCFAHFNLGRVFERRQDFGGAERHYERALETDPGYRPARLALRRLRANWN
ncbi:MAG: tetratricopeptide repeat protein [Terriglobales bacterium]